MIHALSLSTWIRRFTLIASLIVGSAMASEPLTLNLWPGAAPGETKTLPPESDQTKPDDPLIAGRRIIKLGNVSTPQVTLYQPAAGTSNGAAVIICPGGGHYILAYDLEGTEVAEWFNSIGVTAIVLKYRVPGRDPQKRWEAAVQDAQRAVSLVRSRADEWKIDPERIGILGFSAGGQTAALTSIFLDDRKYDTVDEIDTVSSRPNFAMLIYPGGLTPRDGGKNLYEYIHVSKSVPPMFFVHARDDPVPVQNSLALAAALRKFGISADLNIYPSGGHGYGLRPTEEEVTHWPKRAESWMRKQGFLGNLQADD